MPTDFTLLTQKSRHRAREKKAKRTLAGMLE
jgi:hypothetical protein